MFVGGDLIGGGANYTGTIFVNSVKTLTIRGDIVGISGAQYSATIYAGVMGKTYIGGSIYGSNTDATILAASIYVGNGTKSLVIAGSIIGGMGNDNARLNLNGTTSNFVLGGDLTGGDGDTSGNIRGTFTKALIKGNLNGGNGLEAGGSCRAGSRI